MSCVKQAGAAFEQMEWKANTTVSSQTHEVNSQKAFVLLISLHMVWNSQSRLLRSQLAFAPLLSCHIQEYVFEHVETMYFWCCKCTNTAFFLAPSLWQILCKLFLLLGVCPGGTLQALFG